MLWVTRTCGSVNVHCRKLREKGKREGKKEFYALTDNLQCTSYVHIVENPRRLGRGMIQALSTQRKIKSGGNSFREKGKRRANEKF
jgi:hypothetical protein